MKNFVKAVTTMVTLASIILAQFAFVQTASAFTGINTITVDANSKMGPFIKEGANDEYQTGTNPVTGKAYIDCTNITGPGTPAYYNNRAIRETATNAKYPIASKFVQVVNGDPQVPGGAQCAPLADEEDVSLKAILAETGKTSLDLETMSGSRKLYIVKTPIDRLDKNGREIYFRRKKATKMIVLCLNCGNWTRETGAGYTPPALPQCQYFATAKQTDVYDTNGKKVGIQLDYNCGKIEYQIEPAPEPVICPDCVKGSYTPVLNKKAGDTSRRDPTVSQVGSMKDIMKGTSFTLAEALEGLFNSEEIARIVNEMKRTREDIESVKFKTLIIGIDPCPNADGSHNVWFDANLDDKQPDKVSRHRWGKLLKWIIPIAIAVAVIIIVKTRGGKNSNPLIKNDPAYDVNGNPTGTPRVRPKIT